MRNLRIAVRSLIRTPGVSCVAALTLALGVGANTAIFTVVNGVLLRPLPFANADEVVRVWLTTADQRESGMSAGDFLDLRRENRSLAVIAGHRQNQIAAAASGEPLLFAG